VNNEVHTLTGAYVLDALSEMERRDFEIHMAGCAACSQEVTELRETTARLGAATAANPPPQLWNKVLAATRQARQLPPLSPTAEVIRPKRWSTRIAMFAAAASFLAAVGIGIGWLTNAQDLEDQVMRAQSQLDKIQSVLSAPDAEVNTTTVGSNGTATAILSRSQNGMVVLVRNLPPLPPNHVYQAWFLKPAGKPQSAGMLGATNGSMTADDLIAAEGANQLGFTVEPTGGSSVPSMEPLARVKIPT
jgi:anti-sigma-K factor RskA